MPTYEYKCERCGKFEHWQSIKDDPLASCPTCGSPVKRLISNNVNIIFKGPGFYVTDNRSGSYKERAKEEGGSADGSNGSAKEFDKVGSASDFDD